MVKSLSPERRDPSIHERGLSEEDYDYLNSAGFKILVIEQKREVLLKLRQKYINCPGAMLDLDTFDLESELHIKTKAYSAVLKSGNADQERELKKWFEDNGYMPK